MSLFVNLRAGPWGAVCDPYVLEGTGEDGCETVTSVGWNAVPLLARGKDVVLATHGFNVGYEDGLHCLGRLEAALSMRPAELFLGVLWPGDFAVPAVNYPFEDKIASDAGKRLGAFCNRWLVTAASLSFISHSLGARVVLEAIAALERPARRACLAAGAIDADCLTAGYKAAAANCGEIRTLASRKDLVLEFAYPPGDLVADILDPDHCPFEPALGRGGPREPYPSGVRAWEIPDDAGYDHGDYLPSGAAAGPVPDPYAKWIHPVQFMAAAFRGGSPAWPPV